MSMGGIAGMFELVGGILLVIGLFTRPAAFILSGVMAVAYFMFHAPQSVYPIVNGRGTRAPEGEVSIQPGGSGLTAELTDVASGEPRPVLTTITIVFERAGEITVQAVPTSPAPPPPPPRQGG